MKNIIFWTWCFPQTLLGLILKLIYKAKKIQKYKIELYYSEKMNGGISLGKYIILGKGMKPKDIMHEFGHQKQSFILGWLYLPIIGLPSLIWANCFGNYRKKHNVSYYSFYTEKIANKLGGVNES